MTDLRKLVSDWEKSRRFLGEPALIRHFPARPAAFGRLDPPLDPDLARQLAHNGIRRLYGHQTKACL